MVGLQGENDEYKHYDVHSLYGWSMAIPSQRFKIVINYENFEFINQIIYKQLEHCMK